MEHAQLAPPTRPAFNSALTSDRLREGTGLLPSTSNIHKGRRSVFLEHLIDDEPSQSAALTPPEIVFPSPGLSTDVMVGNSQDAILGAAASMGSSSASN